MPNREESTPSALRDALAAERVRNTRLVNVGRLLCLLSSLVIDVTIQAQDPNYLGGHLWLHATWLGGAVAVLLASRSSAKFAEHAGLFLPLVDVPLFFLLIQQLVDDMTRSGFPGDARVVAAGITVYFALLVLLSGAILERRMVALCAASAMGFSSYSQYDAGVDPSHTIFMMTAIGLAFLISITIRSRSIALVTAVADEQLRRERLGRYFSPQIAERLLARGDEAGRGENREVTVLFADLRDFTAIGEAMRGPEVVDLLNSVHEALVGAIFENGGTLDKYMGDGIMAYFGAPVDQPDHPARALRCAAAMQAAIGRLNEQRLKRGETALRLGIGIHSGRVVLGDIGASRRREFTVIGHAVNIAARLEQLTKKLGVAVLASEETARGAGDAVATTLIDTVAIRGQAEPMRVYGFAHPT